MRATTKNTAPLYAALGETTRLSIVFKLSDGRALSITQLTRGTGVTRQAITKHLHILEDAGLVRGVKTGRENRFQLIPHSVQKARDTLDSIARQWDDALDRLKNLVEK